MSSSFYAGGAPHAGASWRSHRDGDQAPASFPHDDMTAVASSATKVAARSGRDEHSVPVSPPSSGIESERGDEVRRALPAGNQAAMSGNIEQPGARAIGNLPRESSGTPSNDDVESQAISAVALLLLAASATSKTKLPVPVGAAGGVSTNGSPVAAVSSPSSPDAASDASPGTASDHAARARRYTGEEFATITPAGSSCSRAGETWPASSQAVFRPNPRFTDHAPYGVASGHAAARGCGGGGWVGGDRSIGGGGSIGEWKNGSGSGASKQGDSSRARRPQMHFSSLAQLSANDSITPSISSGLDEGRPRSRYPYGNELPARATPVKIIGQQPFSPHNYSPSTPSKIDHNHGPWDDGQDGRYETLPLPPSDSARGGRFFPGGAVQTYGDSGGEAGRGRGRDSEQLLPPSPRRLSSCSTTDGGPLPIQPAWRHDGPGMASPASMSMRVCGGDRLTTSSTAVGPRGRRSPSPTRSAGRRKPGGYRSTVTGEGVGRGWKAMSPGGGGGGGGSSSRGGRTRRWMPHTARSVGVGGQSGGSTGSVGRADVGEQHPDAMFQQHHPQDHQHYQQRQQQHPQLQTKETPARFYKQQPQQQGETDQVQSGCWSRKRSRIVVERNVENNEEREEEGAAVGEKLQPSTAQAATGQMQWRNDRAAMRASAAVGSSSHPPSSKRHRSGGAQKASTAGSLKMGESRRPRAMDLDMDMAAPSESSGAAPAATNKGAAGYPSRPSPRKKSKNLVWSQFRKACDRCTDKKVRCDGSNPTGGFKACTPCKKAGVSCLFGICRRSGPRDAHGHKTAAAGVIMKRNDFEKVTERLGQCRTPACRFVNEDGSFWREHFHCRVGDCSFAGKNMSELLLHRGKDHPELPEVVESSATAATATAAAAAAAASDEPLPSDLVKEIAAAAPCEGGVVC